MHFQQEVLCIPMSSVTIKLSELNMEMQITLDWDQAMIIGTLATMQALAPQR